MLLIDEIISEDESSIICRKRFDPDEPFLQGHFPGSPVVPGVIQCECCLQAGAVLVSGLFDGLDESIPVATRIDNVKFKQMVRPGDVVDIEVTLKERVSSAFFLTGKVRLGSKLAARLDFAVTASAPPQ